MSNPQIVTALKAQKQQQQRVNVFLNNKFAFGLNLENIYKFKIKIGTQLTKEQINEILNKDKYQQNLEKAIQYISLRPRSEYEIDTWLQKKIQFLEKNKALISSKIKNHLKKLNLINDQNFTKWWIQQRTTYKPRGKRLLFQELLQKKIPKSIIEKHLHGIPSQTANIQILTQKKLKTLHRYKPKEQKNKLTAFLLRKGYQYSEIKPVIDEILSKD